MNADEIVKALRWCAENDEFIFAADIMREAASLIETEVGCGCGLCLAHNNMRCPREKESEKDER